jgi:hypothetical protein
MPTSTEPTPTLTSLLPVGAAKTLDLTATSAPGLLLSNLLGVLTGTGTIRVESAERTVGADSVRVQGNAELNFLNLVRLPKLPVQLEAKPVPAGMRFTTAFALPAVGLRQLMSGFGAPALPLPSQFDLAFAGGPVQLQQSPNSLQLQYATTMTGLGPAAFLAKCTPAAQSRWQMAAALDLGSALLSSLPGLGALRVFESVFPLNSLLLVVSSADADGFDEGDFALPGLATGTPAISTDKLQQIDSVKKGLNLYGKWQLNSTKREQKLLRTLLGLDQNVSVVLQVGSDPSQGSSLYAHKDTTIKGMPFNCQFGGQLSEGKVNLFVNGTLEATIQGKAVQFDANLVFMPNGALLAGSMLGSVAFAGLTLSNLGLAIGLSWEGLPSLGIAATLTLASFNSSLAVLFDSAEPTKSMLAGAISDLTLNDVITTFTQTATPAQLADVLKQVKLSATSDQALVNASNAPLSAAEVQAVVTALDGRDLETVAAALAKIGIVVPSTSADVLLVAATPGQKWHLTDMAQVLHYELVKQGDSLRVALSPQLYVVPQDTSIGAMAFKQGFFINTKLSIFFFKATVKITVKPTEGIAVAGSLEPIVLGHKNLFSIHAASKPDVGASISLATFSQTVPAPAPAPPSTPALGQPYPNQPYNPGQPYPNQPYNPGQPYPNQPYNPSQPYQNQPFSNQPYPNQPYPNQPYPNQPYPNQPYPNYNPGQPYPNQPYQNQPYPNQPYSPYGPQGPGMMPPNYSPAPAPPAKPGQPAAAAAPLTVVKGPHFQLDGEVTLLGMQRGILVSIDGSGATFALTGTITPGVTADLSGRFTGKNDLRVDGSFNAGIGSIDFGPLGRLNLYTGVQGSLSLGVDSTHAWATFQGSVQGGGQKITLPSFDLSIETGSFAELPQKLLDLVRATLTDLFKDAAKWAAFVQQGFMTGVYDVSLTLTQYYRLSTGQMAQALVKAGYGLDYATSSIMNYSQEGIYGAAKALQSAGFAVGQVGDALVRASGFTGGMAGGMANGVASSVAGALRGANYGIQDVSRYLGGNLRVGSQDLLVIFRQAGYSVGEVNNYLQASFGASASAVANNLKSAGYALTTITPFLATNFKLPINELMSTYKAAGYTLTEATSAIKGAGYVVQDAGPAIRNAYRDSATATLGGLRDAGFAVKDAAQFIAKSFTLNDQALTAAMKGANCKAAEISGALATTFGTVPAVATQLLAAAGYGAAEVMGALKSSYNLPKEGAAQVLKALNCGSTEAANALRNGYGVAKEETARLLKNVGYDSVQTAQAIMSVYNVPRDEASRVLGVAGYAANEVNNALGTAGSAIASGATTVISGASGFFKKIF